MNKRKHQPTEAELADLSVDELDAWADEEFTGEMIVLEPPAPRRLDATISVRFSAGELEQIRSRAAAAGMKVTAFIRAVVLEHEAAEVIDIATVRERLGAIAREVHEIEHQLS